MVMDILRQAWGKQLCQGHHRKLKIPVSQQAILHRRCLHVDGRTRMSSIWAPNPTVASKDVKGEEGSHDKLVRAGFLRQAHSGLFHMLHLGLRVEDKLAVLIDKHMRFIGASRLAMSTISSQELWERSGRLQGISSELFLLADRKEKQLLLGPTHEEEITTLIANNLKSYKQLPLRLFQITRKYRDELRPRYGLLRGREFMMKDLYTFDLTIEDALSTYEDVRKAYANIFAELKLPILVAKASSGDMGGDLSHEYHLPMSIGNDDVITSDGADYVANSEVARSSAEFRKQLKLDKPPTQGLEVWRGVTKDRKKMVNVWYPSKIQTASGEWTSFSPEDVNIYAVKDLVPNLQTGISDVSGLWASILEKQVDPDPKAAAANSTANDAELLHIIDARLPDSVATSLKNQDLPSAWPSPEHSFRAQQHPVTQRILDADAEGIPLDILRLREGDPCPLGSSGQIRIHKAIELGHTFHLGTRYTLPLGAATLVPRATNHDTSSSDSSSSPPSQQTLTTLQMGCHGIGVSRIIGAVAEHLADDAGLNWPRVMAPYEVVVLPGRKLEDAAQEVYDSLAGWYRDEGSERKRLDVLLDDREDSSLGWKLKDADLVGYPVIVVVGAKWRDGGRQCEVQCRRLGVKETVAIKDLPDYVDGLLEQL